MKNVEIHWTAQADITVCISAHWWRSLSTATQLQITIHQTTDSHTLLFDSSDII